MTFEIVIQLLLALGVGSVLAAAVNGWVNRKKINSESKNTDVNSANAVFEMQRKHIQDSDVRLEAMAERLDKMELENEKLLGNVRYLQSVVWEQNRWINNAFSTLTAEQLALVGPPPKLVSAMSSPTPNEQQPTS